MLTWEQTGRARGAGGPGWDDGSVDGFTGLDH